MAEKPWVPHFINAHDLSLAKTSLGSIAKKYGVTPQQIAKANGVAWNTPSIDAWVLRVGGKRLSSGYTTFTVGNKILLPWPPVVPGPGDDKRPEAPMASSIKGAGMPWWAWMGLAAGGVWLYRRRKKKQPKKATATVHRF